MNTLIQPDNKATDKELILYLRETINNICDRVRNKMVAPYATLHIPEENFPDKNLLNISKEDINWLCHSYIPKILSEVSKKTDQLK